MSERGESARVGFAGILSSDKRDKNKSLPLVSITPPAFSDDLADRTNSADRVSVFAVVIAT
jgi:hypothetical protein